MFRSVSTGFATLLLWCTAVFAQPIHLDLSAGQVEVHPPETLRINHLQAVGYSGTYWVDVQWDATRYVFVPVMIGVEVALPPPPAVDPLLAKTELLRGHWHFVYTIISTFTDDYTLTTIPGTKNPQGGYFINGTNQWGGPVVASYFPEQGWWALLDPGTIIDQFYTFYTDGQTILPGSCYYLINPPGSTNLSRCYTLTGVKTSPAAAARARQQPGGDQTDIEQAKAGEVQATADERRDQIEHSSAMETYWLLEHWSGQGQAD